MECRLIIFLVPFSLLTFCFLGGHGYGVQIQHIMDNGCTNYLTGVLPGPSVDV